jgi:hypothetical protein
VRCKAGYESTQRRAVHAFARTLGQARRRVRALASAEAVTYVGFSISGSERKRAASSDERSCSGIRVADIVPTDFAVPLDFLLRVPVAMKTRALNPARRGSRSGACSSGAGCLSRRSDGQGRAPADARTPHRRAARRRTTEARVGLLVRIEALDGKADEVAEFLEGALPLAIEEPATTAWSRSGLARPRSVSSTSSGRRGSRRLLQRPRSPRR